MSGMNEFEKGWVVWTPHEVNGVSILTHNGDDPIEYVDPDALRYEHMKPAKTLHGLSIRMFLRILRYIRV